jgi:3-oxoacyl-[acyl-carrier protein] reductase
MLITGPSRGIGRALATGAAGAGHPLALMGRDSADLDSVVAECQELGVEVLPLRVDVVDADGTAEACRELDRRWGGVEILVNNAGVGRYAPFMELTASDWEAMLDTNVTGVVNVTRGILPGMIARGGGHIVNICSIRGIETIPGTTAYAASKFALVGLSQALRQELEATGVVVSMIFPGGVTTDFGGIPGEDKDPSFLTPEKVAEVVLEMIDHAGSAWIRDLTVMPYPGSNRVGTRPPPD